MQSPIRFFKDAYTFLKEVGDLFVDHPSLLFPAIVILATIRVVLRL